MLAASSTSCSQTATNPERGAILKLFLVMILLIFTLRVFGALSVCSRTNPEGAIV